VTDPVALTLISVVVARTLVAIDVFRKRSYVRTTGRHQAVSPVRGDGAPNQRGRLLLARQP